MLWPARYACEGVRVLQRAGSGLPSRGEVSFIAGKCLSLLGSAGILLKSQVKSEVWLSLSGYLGQMQGPFLGRGVGNQGDFVHCSLFLIYLEA